VAQANPIYMGSDFTVYYTAFTMVREGVSFGLYDQTMESKYQQEIMGGEYFDGGWLPFPIPPFFALIFSPISLIPRVPAYYLWTLMLIGLLIWLLVLLDRLFKNWSKREKQVMILIIMAFWPLAHTFLLGQLSIFILICMVQIYMLMKESKQVKAGIWMALLILKPQTMMMPAVVTINKRYWRVAISAIVTTLAIVFISSLIMGFRPWMQYIELLKLMSNSFGEFGIFPNVEYTFRGTLYNILGSNRGEIINVISITALVLAMGLIYFLWKKASDANDPFFELVFAIAIALSVILSLHLFDHDSLMLVLPAALFYDYLKRTNSPTSAYSIFLLLCPMVFFFSAVNPFNFLGVIRPPVVMIIIFLGWMIVYLYREMRVERMNRLTSVPNNNMSS
jgi:hypothetical protein